MGNEDTTNIIYQDFLSISEHLLALLVISHQIAGFSNHAVKLFICPGVTS